MGRWYDGNVLDDAGENRSWLVGHFKEPGDVRYDEDVEIKVSAHKRGDQREEWVVGEVRRTFLLVMSGRWELTLAEEHGDRESTMVLFPGDYAVWEQTVAHRWRALADSMMVTVRWPSVTVEERAELEPVPVGATHT